MKFTHKKIRAIVFFLIATSIGFINSPLAIAVEICFLLWELLEEEEEEKI